MINQGEYSTCNYCGGEMKLLKVMNSVTKHKASMRRYGCTLCEQTVMITGNGFLDNVLQPYLAVGDAMKQFKQEEENRDF